MLHPLVYAIYETTLACAYRPAVGNSVFFQFPIEGCLADPEHAGGHQFVAIEFGEGVHDG